MKKTRRNISLALAAALCLCLALGAGPAALAANAAPVAENLELTTYRNVSVGGRLSAVDPEGDLLTFEITTEPRKGTVELTGDGRFVYTPAENKKGRDYFGFQAVDSEGNRSQEATVIIKIAKQKTAVIYSDMAGSGTEYAAVCLAESGVYVGASVGGQYVFGPDQAVSRGEFLAMCMTLCGRDLLSGVKSTGFSNDRDIAAWLKPYISTALLDGVITGMDAGGSATFDAAGALTVSEAAFILNGVLHLTDVSADAYEGSETVPVWAAQSVANLAACDILDGDALSAPSLTRAEAAEMLSQAARLIR